MGERMTDSDLDATLAAAFDAIEDGQPDTPETDTAIEPEATI